MAQRRIKAVKVMMMIGPQQVEEENRGKKMGFLAQRGERMVVMKIDLDFG